MSTSITNNVHTYFDIATADGVITQEEVDAIVDAITTNGVSSSEYKECEKLVAEMDNENGQTNLTVIPETLIIANPSAGSFWPMGGSMTKYELASIISFTARGFKADQGTIGTAAVDIDEKVSNLIDFLSKKLGFTD